MKTGLFIAALLISSLASAKSADAVYEVPGFPPGAAIYDMAIKLEIDGDDVFADYELPQDLTGAKNRVQVAGSLVSPGIAVLKGDKGELVCNFQTEKCDARYKDLVVDLDLVKERLSARGLSSDQVELGLQVSSRFQGDPIGVIHFFR